MVLGSTVNAQNFYFNWANRVGNTYNDNINSIAVDNSGNVYSVGAFQNTVDFDPGAGTYNLSASGTSRDVYVLKLDANGNFVWAKRIGDANDDYGNGLCVDASGYVYLTGSFEGTVDFNPGAGTANLTSVGVDAFILKLDTDGNYVWAKSFGGDGSDGGNSITVDASCNIYTTGGYQNTADFDPGNGYYNLTSVGSTDIYINKLDPNGNFLYVVSMGGTSYDGTSYITLDNSGNVYVTGSFQGTADFDTGAGTNNFTAVLGYDIFVSKFDADLNYSWAKQLGGTGDDKVKSITVDGNGNIYTAGSFGGTIDLDPSGNVQELTTLGYLDIFISKLNSSGDYVWCKQLGGTDYDEGSFILTDASNNVYITGYFRGTVDFNPGTETFEMTSFGISDIFVLKLDASANFISAFQLGGTSTDIGNVMDFDQSGNLVLAGKFKSTVDFDPGANTYNLTSSGGNDDVFISKYSQTLPAPEINITGNSISIADGDNTPSTDDNTDFGNVGTGSSITKIFTIENSGTSTLNLTNSPNVIVSGTGFTVTTDAPDVIYAGTSATFEVTFIPTGCGTSNGTISINNDDTDENPYNFSISATGFDITPPETPDLPELTNECSLTVTAPTTTDNCAGTVTGTTSEPLTYTQQGTFLITWTFDDGNGNSTTAEQTVIIDDITPPVVPTLADLAGDCSVTATSPTTTDNCAGTITGTACGSATFSNQGVYTLTWTFSDGNGNITTAQQTITVQDNTVPVVNCVSNQTINLNEGETFYTVQGDEFDPTVTSDNCNIANILNNFNSTETLAGEQLEVGIHKITWIITDKSGNVSICNFQVTVDAYVGIKTLEDNGIKIFPNPTNGIVNFNFTNNNVSKISVFDVTGKQLMQKLNIQKTETIDLSVFESGIYIINIYSQNQIFRTKIIKE